MTEFIIVFPVLFLLFLVIIQTALLMTARQMVEYSAFYAARSAIVYPGNDQKIKRAADMACISISPPMTAETVAALRDFALTMGETVIDLRDILDDHPELIGMPITWDMIPGMEIIDRLRHLNLGDISIARNTSLGAGLLVIDTLCRNKNRVLLRYPAAALLTGQEVSLVNGKMDVTVNITHHYAMGVPLVNKLFFYMYVYGRLRGQIRARLESQHLPPDVINEITHAAINRLLALANASPTRTLYLMPIKADATLTIEKEAETMKNCEKPDFYNPFF